MVGELDLIGMVIGQFMIEMTAHFESQSQQKTRQGKDNIKFGA